MLHRHRLQRQQRLNTVAALADHDHGRLNGPCLVGFAPNLASIALVELRN
jgi:hypothetical protein